MRYFHTDSHQTVAWLAEVFAKAEREGSRVRILTDSNDNLKLKIGGGMWSPPIHSTDDPWRDQS